MSGTSIVMRCRLHAPGGALWGLNRCPAASASLLLSIQIGFVNMVRFGRQRAATADRLTMHTA